MSLVKGTNSYSTVSEADLYFEDRLDAAAWTSAGNDLKGQALITATRMLDNMRWVGVASSETQKLAFPRTGEYFDPRLGIDVALDEDEVPERVVNATYEIAYHLLNNDGLLDETGSALSIEVGRIKLDRVRKPSGTPSFAKSLVKPLLLNEGSTTWWRAN